MTLQKRIIIIVIGSSCKLCIIT